MSDNEQSLSRTQSRFVQEALAFVRRRDVFAQGDRVLVAISGGLDSTVLLHSLARVSRLVGIEIVAAHVDHRTRGEASEKEALWVKVLCERLHITLHPITLAITIDGKNDGEKSSNSQDDFRNLRRSALENLAERLNCHKIATAHHANDNVETFLMRAMSGTGVSGLAGMRPVDGIWVKPLLWATRLDLETYAREHRVAWMEDPSNARSDYLRNQIRNQVLPILEESRQGSLKNIAKAAERIEEEEHAWEQWLQTQMEGSLETLSIGWVERWPDPLKRRIFRFWLGRLGLHAQPQLIEALLRGEELVHPAGSFLRRSDLLVFTPENEFGLLWQEPVGFELAQRLNLGSSLAWSFLPSSSVRQRAVKLSLLGNFIRPGQSLIAGSLNLSWERAAWPLTVRRMTALEMKEHEAVFKMFKIPRPYVKNWPVLVSQNAPEQILGFVGLQVLEAYRAKNDERCVSIAAFFEETLKPV